MAIRSDKWFVSFCRHNIGLSIQKVLERFVPVTCSKQTKKLVHKRISSSGDELQHQVDAGWVNVSTSVSASIRTAPEEVFTCRSTCH